jgi:hypothetical protein
MYCLGVVITIAVPCLQLPNDSKICSLYLLGEEYSRLLDSRLLGRGM